MEPSADIDEKTYTLDEVKQHKDAKSLWIAISDTVYDVTEFMDEVKCLLELVCINLIMRHRPAARPV